MNQDSLFAKYDTQIDPHIQTMSTKLNIVLIGSKNSSQIKLLCFIWEKGSEFMIMVKLYFEYLAYSIVKFWSGEEIVTFLYRM